MRILVNYKINVSLSLYCCSFHYLMTNLFVETIVEWYVCTSVM